MAGSSQKVTPPLVLVPFVVLHSHFFWVYSVLWFFCNNLTVEQVVLLPQKSLKTRPRAFSEPPTPKLFLPSPTNRPRSKTLSATTVDADHPIRPQRFLRTFQSYIQSSAGESGLADTILQFRPTSQDERNGVTCPPLWWQKTRLHRDSRRQITTPEKEIIKTDDKTLSFDNLTDSICSDSSLSLPDTPVLELRTVLEPSRESSPAPVKRRSRGVSLLLSTFQSRADTEIETEPPRKKKLSFLRPLSRRHNRKDEPVVHPASQDRQPKKSTKIFRSLSQWKRSKRASC
ncbi:hypothetical protein DFQ28_006597 [Apophysomyces sp. BC1034]|nr:hypothetical protein DFQ30_003389 [Apophysomyces sp. BC1015]KAG0183017.1 hypothetical protein DFQ29_000828 [Apophysomyces sp. BC1021]KAG0194748.1 hypothetical protein DFQ28_006597 [Apophysomyces sp. BC1034]